MKAITEKINGAPSAVESIEGNAETVSDFKHKYPALCQRCGKQFTIFHSEGHPDDGETFACGTMVELMNEGMPILSCGYFAAPMIDGNKAVCSGRCMCQPENHAGKGACGKELAPFNPSANLGDVIAS